MFALRFSDTRITVTILSSMQCNKKTKEGYIDEDAAQVKSWLYGNLMNPEPK